MATKNSEGKQPSKITKGQSVWKQVSWKSVLGGLVGSNIRETIEDIRVIRGLPRDGKKPYQPSERPSDKR